MNEKDVEKVVDATLGALSSQENDSNANQLILLTIGDQTPLPVPITSTIPSNIMTLDILALEYSMYRRNQVRMGSGSERHGPLPSLYALLQMLQIPTSPYVPLGNAGNEAFYTLMAFQAMMMGNIRFPKVLVRHAPALPHGPYPVQQGPPHHSYSMPPMMPYGSYIPQPAPSDSRGQSSFLRPDAPPSMRRSSDNPRPRPNSLANSHARQTTTGVPTMSRSQTVFWDDSEFAAGDAPQAGTWDDPVRGRLPLPAFKGIPSSRSISWDDPSNELSGPPPPVRQDSSNASSPARLPQRNSASASSLRLAEPRSQEQSTEDMGAAKDVKAGKEKKNGKENKPKLKSEKSVKDIAGALARFWVG